MEAPKKSLSQNFLVDKNISKKIVNQSNIENHIVLEIGPGYGFMTDSILEANPKKIIIVEKDSKLINYLNNKYKSNNKITIIEKDILKFKLNNYKNLIIVSNLPYNISTKIILYLFNYNKNICEMIFMIQKEVAEKFDYNLNNMNKYKFLTKISSTYSKCFNVSSNVFFPKPKVTSSVVKFSFNQKNYNLKKANIFANLIFKNVRKKISNNIKIKKFNDMNLLEKRVSQLSIDELLTIYYSF